MAIVRRRLERVEYKYLVASAFVFGLFMDILDTTIVNVALPRMAEELHASTALLEWVITGYLVSLALWIPASGWIGDKFGTKRTFLFATAMFVIGSALCGFAWSIESLVVFRIVQGVGGGMMTPVGTAMLYRAFTPQERARASAVMSIPTGIAPMLGPLFGGFLVDSVGWRWIFYVNLPVGALSFLFSAMVLREHREEGAGPFDPFGFVLSGVGLAGILYALSAGGEVGWSSPQVLVTGLGGAACFAALIVVEGRLRYPMLDLKLYCVRLFRTASVTGFMFIACWFALLFLLPLFLQGLRGLSAFESGLATFPQPLGQMTMVQLTSRLYTRIGARRCLIIAMSGMVFVSVLFLFVDLDTSLWWIDVIMFVRGIFIAFAMVSMQTSVFAAVPRESIGRASSLWNATRQVAAAFGVAVAGTLLITRTNALTPAGAAAGSAAAQHASLLAFHDALAGSGILAVIALLFAFQVREEGSDSPARTSAVLRPVGQRALGPTAEGP